MPCHGDTACITVARSTRGDGVPRPVLSVRRSASGAPSVPSPPDGAAVRFPLTGLRSCRQANTELGGGGGGGGRAPVARLGQQPAYLLRAKFETTMAWLARPAARRPSIHSLQAVGRRSSGDGGPPREQRPALADSAAGAGQGCLPHAQTERPPRPHSAAAAAARRQSCPAAPLGSSSGQLSHKARSQTTMYHARQAVRPPGRHLSRRQNWGGGGRKSGLRARLRREQNRRGTAASRAEPPLLPSA